jgi:hypothetical protein
MDENKLKDSVILGTFEGECADADITNLNGLDITRPVWENVFNSEDFKQGIELGWYIGFLGHPEDPNCMDFRNACIVMTDGRIDNDGKVYGKFNLIDTPVGRIVKSFIDGGVTFGISVRGAGDVDNNSVDPDTFVFRGFDLVSFPAYPNSIPEFTSIAASSDVKEQKKYKNICKTLNENIDGLNTKESIKIVKACFAPQSEEYKTLDEKLNEMDKIEGDVVEEENVTLLKNELGALTHLYSQAVAEIQSLKDQLNTLTKTNESLLCTTNRKVKAIKKIASSQHTYLKDELDNVRFKNKVLSNNLNKVKDESIKASKLNLKYKMNIESNAKKLRDMEAIIASLTESKSKTVENLTQYKAKVSNLEKKITDLSQDIKASENIIADYQDAYAKLYANALGTQLDQISVTSATTVNELEKAIGRNVSERVSIMSSNELDDIDRIDIPFANDDMIVL